MNVVCTYMYLMYVGCLGARSYTQELGGGHTILIHTCVLRKSKNKIYVLISDGELNEGTTWESLLFASFHKLDNLFIIIDYNKIQSLDFVKKVLKIEPLRQKLTSFNCNVSQIDGHNINQIVKSLKSKNNNKPNIIIANTIKGKGVKFMENTVLWHYKSPNEEQLSDAMKDLK